MVRTFFTLFIAGFLGFLHFGMIQTRKASIGFGVFAFILIMAVNFIVEVLKKADERGISLRYPSE